MMHISVDIETFSTAPDASIAAIGAAAWDGSGWTNNFYIVVDDPDGRFDPRTIRWHGALPKPTETMGVETEAVPLVDALMQFTDYLKGCKAHVDGSAKIWSHATFDLPVLHSAYRRANRVVPWHRRNTRDLRTLYDLSGGRPKCKETLDGIEHNALADAIYQREEVYVCYYNLGMPFADAWGEGVFG